MNLNSSEHCLNCPGTREEWRIAKEGQPSCQLPIKTHKCILVYVSFKRQTVIDF